jgi:hypothetical protein
VAHGGRIRGRYGSSVRRTPVMYRRGGGNPPQYISRHVQRTPLAGLQKRQLVSWITVVATIRSRHFHPLQADPRSGATTSSSAGEKRDQSGVLSSARRR